MRKTDEKENQMLTTLKEFDVHGLHATSRRTCASHVPVSFEEIWVRVVVGISRNFMSRPAKSSLDLLWLILGFIAVNSFRVGGHNAVS